MSQARLPLKEMTLRQLRKVASECGVSRYSRMRKEQLLSAIESSAKFGKNLTSDNFEAQKVVEALTLELRPTDQFEQALAAVDENLHDLPSGYGDSRIVIMPRDPQWAYAYWDVSNDHKQALRQQGGQALALRLYDVTDTNMGSQSPHSLQEYFCDELAREWYLPVPVSDRDYILEIGYRCADGRWLVLASSAAMRVPPVYPADWVEDHFLTLDWEENLRGKTFLELVPPSQQMAPESMMATPADDHSNAIFGWVAGGMAQRVAGSLYGSMQQTPLETTAISSYVFPSGMGLWALPTASGLTMSGAGFSASAPPLQPRQFWLIADAELIVYGATEPDATVTIGGRPIPLNSDGTFRFQMSFQDGLIDYPIMAVAIDGQQTREIHMKFERETPARRTNTKEAAVQEWLA